MLTARDSEADLLTGLAIGAGDPRSHESRADDAEPLDTNRRRRVLDSGILFELVRREEDLHELARDVGHRELAEQLRLALQSLGHAVLETVLDRVERGERRRIVATGALEHLLAGAAEHERAPQRIAVEQEAEQTALTLTLGAPTAGHAAGRGERDVRENGRRHELVDHAEPERRRGGAPLSSLPTTQWGRARARAARADQPGQTLATARAGQNSELNLRQADRRPRMIGRHAVVAGEGKLEPSAQARAVNSHRDWLGEARDPLQHFLPIGRQSLRRGGGAELHELLDVCTRDEIVLLAREERDGAHAAVVSQRREARQELVFHRTRNDVDGLALEIEDDGRNRSEEH